MSHYIEVTGGSPLKGEVQISGAKNALLPQLIASLVTAEPVTFTNVPALEDTGLTIRLLETLGGEVDYSGETLKVCTPTIQATEASYSLVKAIRASFWVLGPLLARERSARVALPGGDIIGARPVDIHLDALTKMGAHIQVKHGVVIAEAPHGLRPAEITFRFPSVGATHQILMAAALTPGVTVIHGAAREPEVTALAQMLTAMGAHIEGAGESTIRIEGQEHLKGGEIALIGDRIEAGTYLLGGLMTGGEVTAQGVDPAHLTGFLDILSDLGAEISLLQRGVRVRSVGRLKPIKVTTAPFPGFATDLQAPLMAALTLAEGVSVIEESIFEGRFGTVSELCRMGAQISVQERQATITGVAQLSGAEVEARDIRAGSSLLIAGLAAEGTTIIHEPHHIRRGYSHFEKKVTDLGGKVRSRVSDPEDFLFTGC